MLRKKTSHRRMKAVQFQAYEASRIVRFTETESRVVTARSWGWEEQAVSI